MISKVLSCTYFTCFSQPPRKVGKGRSSWAGTCLKSLRRRQKSYGLSVERLCIGFLIQERYKDSMQLNVFS